ncbi:prolyl oligopeptidase family serine peptidase [Undibacterium sp. LX40W]|uniref:Prolyl oligopeptidase family serine peptidase n=1 Tax=Undibacterium nitidum TaxID=2762298 RepID=A0A923HRB6_9BURK|nr:MULTISPECIES: prolyl oligopeptidase family serine peptidase [Undibacterium]MBC3882651.1 prolyl oligopeptidase family serine peptidase [Undibacterium nitidum]MBC3892932.1 prolyl oligopeptidase family serine peptidase [Undibacterium sp. LX40W]
MKIMHLKKRLFALSLSCINLLLCACGGEDHSSEMGLQIVAPPPDNLLAPIASPFDVATKRGQIISATVQGKVSQAEIDASVDPDEAPLIGDKAKCNVMVIKLIYATIGPVDQAVQASAGLLMPIANGDNCKAPFPLVVSNHGTNVFEGFSQTSPKDGSVLNASAYYASQGYAVVLPDYLGYGASTLDYHPNLHAENSAAVVIDAVRAARAWFSNKKIALNGKLFLAGTSEGGYVTMTTQRVMERDFPNEFKLTAVMAASGPYNTTMTMDMFMAQPDEQDSSKTLHATMFITALQKTYLDIYSDPIQVFNAPWNLTVENLIPGTNSESELFTKCHLPYNLKDYPSRVYPGCDPTTDSIPLLQANFVSDYLQKSNDLLTPASRARAHVEQQNLLKDWTPKAILGVCYGTPDNMATPNALSAQAYFTQRGYQLLRMENVETETTEPIKTWIATQEPKHPDGFGYHGKVEAPACVSWARHQIFDPLAH